MVSRPVLLQKQKTTWQHKPNPVHGNRLHTYQKVIVSPREALALKFALKLVERHVLAESLSLQCITCLQEDYFWFMGARVLDVRHHKSRIWKEEHFGLVFKKRFFGTSAQ